MQKKTCNSWRIKLLVWYGDEKKIITQTFLSEFLAKIWGDIHVRPCYNSPINKLYVICFQRNVFWIFLYETKCEIFPRERPFPRQKCLNWVFGPNRCSMFWNACKNNFSITPFRLLTIIRIVRWDLKLHKSR